ncbi:MAG: sugar transferase [Anaerolineae bacterium]|nr:sugar transferase [Anaerolineae bacterium]
MFFSPLPRRRPQLPISERRLLLALGDLAAVFISVVIAMRIWTQVSGDPFSAEFILPRSGWFVVLSVIWLLLASANDFFELQIAASRSRTFQRLFVITLQTWVVYIIVFFLAPVGMLPRLFVLYYGIASLILIGLWRFNRPFLVGWASDRRRTLIVGADDSAEVIINTIRSEALSEYDVRGIIGSNSQVGSLITGVPVLGSGADVMNFVRRDRISLLIVTETSRLDAEAFQGVMDAYEAGISIVPMALEYERITGRVPIHHISGDWAVIFLSIRNSDGIFDPFPPLKRLIDILLALIGLFLFVLIFPLVVLIQRLDSRGPVFYTQKRVGRHGRLFTVYKLRSMIPDAEAASGPVFSSKDDKRVTRFGRFMRKSRLDEVPQLLNVLRGDMSIVGPRPERPEHISRLTEQIPFYRTRLIVRPGLTGWAQVRYDYGANDVDAMVKLQYDLYYIRHQSLLLDVNIMLRTVRKIASLSGV